MGRFLCQAILSASVLACAVASAQGMTIAEQVELARIYRAENGEAFVSSPDGRKAAFVIERADLARNARKGVLYIAEKQDLPSGVVVKQAAEFYTTVDGPPVAEIRWSHDGDKLMLRAREPTTEPQLFAYDLRSDRLDRLTHETYGVFAFDYQSSAVAYLTAVDAAARIPSATQAGLIPPGTLLYDLVLPGPPARELRTFRLKTVRDDGSDSREVWTAGTRQMASRVRVWLSPDLSRAVVTDTVEEAPADWARFGDKRRISGGSTTRRALEGWLDRLVAVNLADGRSEPVTPYPTGRTFGDASPLEVRFSDDGSAALIAPMRSPGADAVSDQAAKLLLYRFDTREWSAVMQLGGLGDERDPWAIAVKSWQPTQRIVRARARYGRQMDYADDTPIVIRYGARAPARIEKLRAANATVEFPLKVREALDSPQEIVSMVAGREIVLLDPNSSLRGRPIGRTTVVSWPGTDGRVWHGGLLLPDELPANRRIPAIIQTRGWTANAFLNNGPFPNTFAARAFVAHGFAVLQMEDAVEAVGRPGELAAFLSGIRGAAEFLQRNPIVDTNALGLIGFSRTALHVKSALIRTDLFRSATAADGGNGEYLMYVLHSGWSGIKEDAERLTGGAPLGEGMSGWLQNSASFNYDRIRTPLLLEANSGRALLVTWEPYAMMSFARRPVDLAYYPGGAHVLFSPADRFKSQTLNLDWHLFWLTGRIDRDPAKAAQYEHWLELAAACKRASPTSPARC